MKITQDRNCNVQIIDLFARTFTQSEGPEEGALIQELVTDLLATTPEDDIRVFITGEDGALCAAAVFTRLSYAADPRTVFILSPMAVAPEHQRKGLGQALLGHALTVLKNEGVDIAVTYGDPNYYEQVGFHPVAEDLVPAPLPLAHPEGWIAQSLTDAPLTSLDGPARCVSALNRPQIW
jgi:predicted N-acetyltransferase YhbS